MRLPDASQAHHKMVPSSDVVRFANRGLGHERSWKRSKARLRLTQHPNTQARLVVLSRSTKGVVGGSFTLNARIAFGDGCDRPAMRPRLSKTCDRQSTRFCPPSASNLILTNPNRKDSDRGGKTTGHLEVQNAKRANKYGPETHFFRNEPKPLD